jgi:hypothetical protein
MLLWHGRFGAIENVCDQPPAVWQFDLVAVNVLYCFLINQEQVILTGPPGDVNVLA